MNAREIASTVRRSCTSFVPAPQSCLGVVRLVLRARPLKLRPMHSAIVPGSETKCCQMQWGHEGCGQYHSFIRHERRRADFVTSLPFDHCPRVIPPNAQTTTATCACILRWNGTTSLLRSRLHRLSNTGSRIMGPLAKKRTAFVIDNQHRTRPLC